MTKENVVKFAEANDKLESLKEIIKEKKEEFEKSIADLVEQQSTLSNEIERLKEGISKEAISIFEETGNKKLDYGIGIQERKKLSYDEGEVFDWSLDKKLYLQLDKKAFEKVAEFIGAPTVKVETNVIATFPKKIKLED